MEKAAELLGARGLTVREVAHRVGYRQPAQFAKAFRRHHGSAPSDYRTENGRPEARRFMRGFPAASIDGAARAA
jgi:AraC-like DNA-binding protein